MWETIEHSLEAVNAVISMVILYFGLRARQRLTLAFQRHAVQFFLIAIALFALSELLTFASGLGLLANIEMLRELVETGFVAFLALALYMLLESDRREVTTLRQTADTDMLTGLNNHAFFCRAIERRFEQAQEYGFPLSLVLLDLDDFKSYNDTFGHEAGNAVLSCIAQVLGETVRADDIVARYGGEEFVVVMSDKLDFAVNTAERIRINIESHCVPTQNVQIKSRVTASLGVSSLNNEVRTVEALIEAADKQMYRAKEAGKNCVKTEDTA